MKQKKCEKFAFLNALNVIVIVQSVQYIETEVKEND